MRGINARSAVMGTVELEKTNDISDLVRMKI